MQQAEYIDLKNGQNGLHDNTVHSCWLWTKTSLNFGVNRSTPSGQYMDNLTLIQQLPAMERWNLAFRQILFTMFEHECSTFNMVASVCTHISTWTILDNSWPEYDRSYCMNQAHQYQFLIQFLVIPFLRFMWVASRKLCKNSQKHSTTIN